MKKVNKIGLLVILVVLTLIMVQQVSALGVTPGRKTINFESNLKTSGTFTVINSDQKEVKALLYLEGDLSKYVTLYDSLVGFRDGEDSRSFSYDVNLPESLEPGEHIVNVVVREVPNNAETSGAYVGATVAVISEIKIVVPYPGKYAKATLTVQNAEKGEKQFIVSVRNLGQQDIFKAKAIIDILGPTNEKIASLETEEKPIDKKQMKELVAGWIPAVSSGKYLAKVTVVYDGETTETEQIFEVGQSLVEILDVYVKNFRLGGVAKFEIEVENKFDKDLKDVYAEMSIRDKEGNEVMAIKSASENIQALSRGMLYTYWDTENVKEGVYSAKLTVNYEGKSTERMLRAVVGIDSIKVEFVGITAEAVGLSTSGRDSILTVLVFILVGVNIGWFFYFKKRRKKKEQNSIDVKAKET